MLEEVEALNDCLARMCIVDLSPDMRHNTLHCLTWGYSIKPVCGFELAACSILLALCMPVVMVLYPNCDVLDDPG